MTHPLQRSSPSLPDGSPSLLTEAYSVIFPCSIYGDSSRDEKAFISVVIIHIITPLSRSSVNLEKWYFM